MGSEVRVRSKVQMSILALARDNKVDLWPTKNTYLVYSNHRRVPRLSAWYIEIGKRIEQTNRLGR